MKGKPRTSCRSEESAGLEVPHSKTKTNAKKAKKAGETGRMTGLLGG